MFSTFQFNYHNNAFHKHVRVWQLSRDFTDSRKLDNLNDLARNLAIVGMVCWLDCWILQLKCTAQETYNYRAVYGGN